MENTEAKNVIKKNNWVLSFFNDKSKTNLKWWNRNYFYAGTILIVIINILIFAFVKKEPWEILGYKEGEGAWTSIFYLKPTLSMFLSSFFHSNWQHVLFNMLCFFVAGIYLERKMGTFGLLGFVLFASYISALAIGANALNIYSVGYSGVNYFIYSTIIIDYILSFQKQRRNKTNIILGAILVCLIYLAMCFSGGTSKISFSFAPYDLIHNMGHYTSFVAGLIVGLFGETIKFSLKKCVLKEKSSEEISSTKESLKKKQKETTKTDNKKRQKKVSKENSLKEKTKAEIEVKEEKVEVKKGKKVKTEKKKALKAEKKVKEKDVAFEEPTVQTVPEVKLEEEKVQVSLPEKKLTALPEDMKNVPARKPYRKKKKATTETRPLVIKPVVAKQPAKKSIKK